MNKKTKNIILMIVTLLLVTGISIGSTILITNKTSNLSATIVKPDEVKTYNITASSSSLGLNVESTFDFRFNDFFEDSTTYNNRVAKFCYLESLDCANIGKITIEGSANTAETDNWSFLNALGFSGYNDFALFNEYETNVNDATRGVIAVAKNSDKSKVLYVVALQPTHENSEWVMNFDIGNSTSEYATLTGATTSEWENQSNHKGYDVCASRVLDELYDYMTSSSDITKAAKEVRVVFTGYSCGAAVSNVACAKLIDELNSKLTGWQKLEQQYGFNFSASAYTFGTPRTTDNTLAKATRYNSIFNHVSTEDIITQVVPTKLSFIRYGKDIEFTMFDNETLKANYKTIAGKEYYQCTLTAELSELINDFLTTRDDLYKVDTSEEATVQNIFYGCTTKEEADVKRDQLIATLKADDLYKYCTISESTLINLYGSDCYCAYINYSTGFILALAPSVIKAINGGGSISSLLGYVSYLNCDKYMPICNKLISSIFNTSALNSIMQYHLPVAYHVLLENYWNNNK